MNVQQVTATASALPAASATPAGSTIGAAASASGDFSAMLGNLLGSLSQTEQNTSNLIAQAAAGQNVDVHDVTIAMQTESLAFGLATQVRNKVVEAYQDVFRTQI